VKHTKQKLQQIALSLSLLALAACSDSRNDAIVRLDENINPQLYQTSRAITAVADIRYQNQDTQFLQLDIRSGQLFATGYGPGVLVMNIYSDPRNPTLVTDLKANAPKRWTVDWYASRAIHAMQNYVLTAGQNGISIFSMQSYLSEVARVPPVNFEDPQTPADSAYAADAIIANQNAGVVYLFHAQEYVLTTRMNTSLSILEKTTYGQPGENVCCMTSAVQFPNTNTIFAGFGNRMLYFDISAGGKLNNTKQYSGLPVSEVAVSADKLWLLANPTQGTTSGTNIRRGLYVFDRNGKNVAYHTVPNDFRKFKVHPNGQTIYSIGPTSIIIWNVPQ